MNKYVYEVKEYVCLHKTGKEKGNNEKKKEKEEKKSESKEEGPRLAKGEKNNDSYETGAYKKMEIRGGWCGWESEKRRSSWRDRDPVFSEATGSF